MSQDPKVEKQPEVITGEWSEPNPEQEKARYEAIALAKIEEEKALTARLSAIRCALEQYEEGAITYVEFYFLVGNKLNQSDLNEYNQLTGENYRL